MDKEPDLISNFYDHGRMEVEWYDVSNKTELPALSWQQVYVVGKLGGKVPIVIYESARHNLPGGKTEAGESVEQTLVREVQEELNCRVVEWQPLGYQKLWRTEDPEKHTYQLRVYAKLNKIGEFVNDPGGSVIGYELIELQDLNRYIGYGKVGDRLVTLATKYF